MHTHGTFCCAYLFVFSSKRIIYRIIYNNDDKKSVLAAKILIVASHIFLPCGVLFVRCTSFCPQYILQTVSLVRMEVDGRKQDSSFGSEQSYSVCCFRQVVGIILSRCPIIVSHNSHRVPKGPSSRVLQLKTCLNLLAHLSQGRNLMDVVTA